MNTLLNDYATAMFSIPKPPCLSLYQPTHRHHPDNQQDPIQFRNLVKALEDSLRQKYPTRDVRPLQNVRGSQFLESHSGGISPAGIPRRVPSLQTAASGRRAGCGGGPSFHLKPLIRILQSADRYHVLGLSRQETKLLEGNRDTLDEVELSPAVPRRVTEVVAEDSKEALLSVWSPSPGAGVRYGPGSRAELVEKETERFFRAVDRAILEHYSRPSGLPLLLAALPEHHSFFRRISRNPFLIAKGLDIHPDALPIEALRDRAWHAIEPHYLARLTGLVEMFGAARSKELGADDLAQVAASAAAGRVGNAAHRSRSQYPRPH